MSASRVPLVRCEPQAKNKRGPRFGFTAQRCSDMSRLVLSWLSQQSKAPQLHDLVAWSTGLVGILWFVQFSTKKWTGTREDTMQVCYYNWSLLQRHFLINTLRTDKSIQKCWKKKRRGKSHEIKFSTLRHSHQQRVHQQTQEIQFLWPISAKMVYWYTCLAQYEHLLLLLSPVRWSPNLKSTWYFSNTGLFQVSTCMVAVI